MQMLALLWKETVEPGENPNVQFGDQPSRIQHRSGFKLGSRCVYANHCPNWIALLATFMLITEILWKDVNKNKTNYLYCSFPEAGPNLLHIQVDDSTDAELQGKFELACKFIGEYGLSWTKAQNLFSVLIKYTNNHF